MEHLAAMWAAEDQSNFLSWEYTGIPAETDSFGHNL
jgi:hypothetical protein